MTAKASAAPLQCDASALRGFILGQGALAPVTANRGASACANAVAGGAASPTFTLPRGVNLTR